MSSAKFEKFAELELTATLLCGNCDAALNIDQELTLDDAEIVIGDSKMKLGVQAVLEGWRVSDLNGRLDGELPICDDCLRNESKETQDG